MSRSTSSAYVLDADAEGQIWIGGDGQIWRVDGGDFTPVPYDDALKFRKMQFDCEGRLWLGTGKGAHCYDGGQFHRITTEDGLPYPNVNGIWQGTAKACCGSPPGAVASPATTRTASRR